MASPNTGSLDSEFSEWFEGYVVQMIDIHRRASPAPRTADVWGCKNLGDFMCGFFVGEMMGAATSTFQARYRRAPSAQEHGAITDIVEGHAQAIRDVFLKFN